MLKSALGAPAVLITAAVLATASPRASAIGDAGLYADPGHWVCRPDVDDVCDAGLDATVVAADGTLTLRPFTPAADARVDCFYIYPTISRDEGTNSDLSADPARRAMRR